MLSSSTAPQVLLLDDANPVFGAPAAWKVTDAIRKVPFIASFGSFLDETSVLADLILPDHSFLESWVESVPESGATTPVASVAGPAMRPLYDTRAMGDVLLDVGRRLARPLDPPLPWQTVEEMLQAPRLEPRRPGDAGELVPGADGLARRAVRWRRHGVSLSLHALRLAGALRRVAGAPALAAGAAGPDHHGDVVQLGGDQPPGGRAAGHRAGRHGRSRVRARVACARRPSSRPASGPMRWPCRWARDTTRSRAMRAAAAPTRSASWRQSPRPTTGALAWAATRVKVTKVGEPDGSLVLFAGATRERPEHASGRG